jgi:hypothetical protein
MKKSLTLGALVVAIMLIAVSSAFADSVTTTGTLVGGKLTSVDTVSVKATINSKILLTVVTPVASQTVDFSAVDPGTSYGPQAVTLTVQSNKAYDLTKITAGQSALMGLSTSLANSLANAKTASQVFTDNYSLNVPWTTDPGNYLATVQYTAVQN